MKKCPKCGTINQDDYRYCEACACKLEENEPKQRSTHLKGSLGSVRYTGASIPNEDDIKSHREHAASSQFKGRIGDKTYAFYSEKTDTPSVRRKFQFDTDKSSESKESRGEFVGRMGKTEYRRTDDLSEIKKKRNNSYKFDGHEPVKTSKKFNRTWLAGAFAAVVVMAIAIPSAIQITQRDKEVPTSITVPDTSVLAYQQFGAELSDLINQYGISSEQDEYSSCRLLVSCDDSVDISSLGATEILQSPDGVYVLQYENRDDAVEASNRLSLMNGVKYAEPDMLVSADNTVAVEPISWGTKSVGADVFADQLSRKNYAQVTVAIVDSGISEHEFLRGRLLDGWDFIGNDADPTDEKNHGTHVAGIVVDATQGLDIALLPVRVLNAEGKGPWSVVGNGIRYAADCGADIINLSLGGGHSLYIDDAVNYALSKGVIVVVSAGNDSTQTSEQCPAHIDGCITVSAVNQDLLLANFSNYGGAVDFCAPGVSIYSSVLNNKYAYLNGTSMSTPYISALAAMLKASGMASTVYEVETLLASCSLDLGASGRDSEYGYGLPQVDKLLTEPEVSPTPKPTDTPDEDLLNETYAAYSRMINDGVAIRYGVDNTIMATHYELLYMDDDAIPEIILYATDMDIHCFEIYTYSGNSPEMIADSWETCDFSQWFNAGFDLCIQENQSQSVFYRSSKWSHGGSAGVLEYNGRSVSNTSVSLDEHSHNKSQTPCKVLMQNGIIGGVEIGSEDDFLKELWRKEDPVPTEAPVIEYASSLWDGEYTVRLTEDSFYTDYGYICAEAEWMLPMSFDEEFVYALEAGSIIDLSDYGYDDIFVTDVSRDERTVVIMDDISPFGYYFLYDNETGLYELNQYAGSGYWPYVASIETLVFSEDVKIHEQTVATDHYLSDPRDAAFEYAGGKMFASIVIAGGLVTEINYINMW